MKFKLNEFLKIRKCDFEFHGDSDILKQPLKGVSIDSRTIQPNEIYFALKGENLDGHEFIDDALRKKAIAAVVEKKWAQKNRSHISNQSIFVVDDTLSALHEFASTYRRQFFIPVIGLTGTNGKTTTKEMIAAVLSKTKNVCKTEGNFNNHIGLPLTLLKLKDEHEVAVIEMGTNHFGEIAQLCEIAEPNYGLITNIGHGHTEFFNSLEGVAKAKMELFDYLRPTGTTFINLDDPMIVHHAPANSNATTYGFKDEAVVRAENLGLDELGYPLMAVGDTQIRINVVGLHNLSNALAAVAVGKEFGVDNSNIKLALENLKLPSKRMQIYKIEGVTVLNDSYNANPESTIAALETLSKMPASGKKFFIFGDMLELGEHADEAHKGIGSSVNKYGVDVFFAYGPLSAHAVESAIDVQAKHFSEKSDLCEELKNLLKTNDLVLVKGSRGMKMEEVPENLFDKS